MGIAATTGKNRLTFLLILPPVVIQVLAAFRRDWPYALRAWLLIAPLAVASGLAYYLTGFKGNASVIGACRSRGVPVAITLGGGYAEDVTDTVAIHAETVRAAARLEAAAGNGPPGRRGAAADRR